MAPVSECCGPEVTRALKKKGRDQLCYAREVLQWERKNWGVGKSQKEQYLLKDQPRTASPW